MATAVSPDAATVAVAPGQLPAVTAASLDGTAGTGQASIIDPGNLADRADQRYWRATVTGGAVTDTHTAASGADGQEFALLTTGGGALVFYTDAAQLTITPPAGGVLHLNVPGFYSPAQALSRARVTDLEQFAAYDPPADGAQAARPALSPTTRGSPARASAIRPGLAALHCPMVQPGLLPAIRSAQNSGSRACYGPGAS